MKQYRAIFLDWDDTIGDWKNAEHFALRDFFYLYHLDELYASPDDFIAAYKPYNLNLWALYGAGDITKEYLHFERFYHTLLANTAPSVNGIMKETLGHIMGDEFLRLTNKYFSLLPHADEMVRYLASKYPLTIVSNGFREVQYYKLDHSGLRDCFAHILISDEVGINKPQPQIFEKALALNNVAPAEVLMIGDSYTSDIAGAKAAGIDSLWIRDPQTAGPLDKDQSATYIVTDLRDIRNII